ncbi:lactate dehydrogenase [Amycolatopsis sp. WAC 01375]|uniref:Ldh family oxidoreductase n=1 Tax=Amycolatopsis sp. WAC 01375 TaxID=2203194 RepID=UPI000F792E31|nr:Ldh family oxidoreductase [Amycolatopsis sp. WAC 01375]RSM70434.1 lactate dehydrogenase [Amycolatopsis sp. WAC 01375]
MTVLVPYPALLSQVTKIFVDRGVPGDRAAIAATALCHGDLTGVTSHGLVNLTRLYLPLLDRGRAEPKADMVVETDLGACVLADARRTLGLWSASQAMELACARASRHGVGMVSLRGATHIGCAGHHAARAVTHGMIGLIASNCGGQRIAPPPGGTAAMLGTNPLALACPAGGAHPFVLDMSTTVVPTGRIRAAAREGREIPPGWLADDDGSPVTDPAAFDRGEAHLQWLGGAPETGAYKGFGLGLLVEVLGALVPGATLGATSADADRDDDIGVLALAIAPEVLRSGFASDASALFTAVRGWPTRDPAAPVAYPGWHEGERAARFREHGVPVPDAVYEELRAALERTPG